MSIIIQDVSPYFLQALLAVVVGPVHLVGATGLLGNSTVKVQYQVKIQCLHMVLQG